MNVFLKKGKMGVFYENLSPTFKFFWLAIVLAYLIVLIGIFSTEINEIKALKTSSSKYDSNQFISYSDSLYNAYNLTIMRPIKEFYLIPKNASCQNSDELLTLKIWNSKEICSYPYFFNYSLGSCPKNDNKSFRLEDKKSFTITDKRFFLSHWGDVQFCVQRYENWYRSSDYKCSLNYTSCPNNVCVIDDKCPINNLVVVNNISDSNIQANTSEISYTLVGNLTNESQIFISRNSKTDFIIDLAVEINGKPCIYEFESPNRTSFSLLKSDPNNCQNYGCDSSIYSLFDSQDEFSFYVQNNINFIYEGIKLENYTSNNTASLYQVIRTKNSCSSEEFVIDSDNSDIESFSNLRYGGDIFGLIFLSFSLVLYIIHIFGLILEGKMGTSFILSNLILLFIFVEAIICPVSLKYLGKIVKNDKFLNNIIDSNCFAISEYNQLFSNYGEEILLDSKNIYGYIHTILYFSLAIFILIVLYLIDKFRFNFFYDSEDNGILEKYALERNKYDDICSCYLADIDCECLF